MSQEKIGLLILRYALVLVYIYFGSSQLTNASQWAGIVPEWATSLSMMSAETIVMFNGIFEIVFAVLLAIGLWTKWVSIILAAHLGVITLTMGYTPTGVRDFGLTLATLAHGLLEGGRKERAEIRI
jgi:uncharacterized membrane protein YphA (DoxX/SURF4 family)